MIGGTKTGEYYRSIGMLKDIIGNRDDKDIMMALFFLRDLQYDNADLNNMARLIQAQLALKEKNRLTKPKK